MCVWRRTSADQHAQIFAIADFVRVAKVNHLELAVDVLGGKEKVVWGKGGNKSLERFALKMSDSEGKRGGETREKGFEVLPGLMSQ